MNKKESESGSSGSSGVLGELPVLARIRLKARAFWDVCPPWAQGAMVWASLSPWTALVWTALTRVDPMGGYQIKWGSLHLACAWWALGLLVSGAVLPLARAMVGLARGDVASWAHFLAELKGLSASTGKPEPASAGAWALLGWAWMGGLGISWLQERTGRVDGITLGNSLPWHMWNGSRMEVATLIFICFAIAALRTKAHPGAPLSWRSAWGALRRALGQAPKAARSSALSWHLEWSRECAKSGVRGASQAAWRAVPFAIRQLILAGAAVVFCWAVGRQLAAQLDPAWARGEGSDLGGWTILSMAWLCAMLAGICSRESKSKVRSGLWFGAEGPGVWAWARFAVLGVGLERAMAWRTHASPLCSDATLSQGGVLIAVCAWAALTLSFEAMAWLGGVFEAWEREARQRGPRGLEAYAGAAGSEIKRWWGVAAGGAVRLGKAVERRALENGRDIALAQRVELEEEIEVPKARAPRRTGRL